MRRTYALLMLLMLLVAGCSGKAEPQAKAPAVENPAPATPAPEPVPAGELQRVMIKPGQPIDRVGLFIMKVATGETEGWVMGGDQSGVFPGSISADNRWISVSTGKTEYLADRTTGTVYRDKGRLLAAHADTLLFSTDKGLAVTADGMKSFHSVALSTKDAWPAAFAVAPDGKHAVAIAGAAVYLIDPAGGQFREIGRLAAPDGKSGLSNAWLAPGSSGPTVTAVFSPTGARAYRFSWEGKLLDDRTLSGNEWFSPDGKLVAWHGDVLGLTHTITIGGAADAQPKLRVKGEQACALPFQGPYWLPDSSGLMLSTTRGPRLLKLDGTLTEPAMPSVNGGMVGIPVPAPDQMGIYAVGGTTVIDGNGKVLAAAVSASPGKWFGVGNLEPWGDRGDEVRFTLKQSGKGVSCDGPSFWAPSVEKAPFPTDLGLTVKVGAGDCVNLRQDTSKDAPVVACLPDGTRLTAAKPPGRLTKEGLGWAQNPFGGGMSDEYWWYARTDQGQRGWVYLTGDYFAWAQARPGEPAPDPMQTRLEDDIVNMRYWLGVAAGQTYCGPNCGGYNQWLPMMAFGGLIDWCKQEVPALQATPGFDPAPSDAVAFVKTCQAVQTLSPDVGRTDRDDVFAAKARELLPGLPK